MRKETALEVWWQAYLASIQGTALQERNDRVTSAAHATAMEALRDYVAADQYFSSLESSSIRPSQRVEVPHLHAQVLDIIAQGTPEEHALLRAQLEKELAVLVQYEVENTPTVDED